ncbi:hypothetical protein [Ruminococcus sp. HUN007]|uniref:hypothetical protein n=1 Tax=Ruminococcus sp. HUN007 TaxID=1514668 RepID=UPI0006799905|nr:hypothetical protein [Ruminococcus sp. HUN007]
MLNEMIVKTALENIAKNPGMLKMPNIPWPVVDAGVFWNTIGEGGGYKLEQNMITQHCRILDRSGIRRGWGSEAAMERLMRQMAGCN